MKSHFFIPAIFEAQTMKMKKTLAVLALILAAPPTFAGLVELTIEFDNFPNETAFGMWDAATAPTGAQYQADPGLVFDGLAYDVGASSPIGFGDGFVLPGDFSGEPANVPFSFIWDLDPGAYTFIILDTFGDGICCGFGAGSYSLAVNGVDVATGGEFTSFEVTNFGVVSEPGSLGLLALALLGFGLVRASNGQRIRS